MKVIIDKDLPWQGKDLKIGDEIEIDDRRGNRWIRNHIAHNKEVPLIKRVRIGNNNIPIIGFVTLQNVEKDEVANTRFRVIWALPYMPNSFISEKYEELRQADVVIFQSRFSVADIKLAEKLKADGVKLIWDFTDPHWLKEYDPHAVHHIFYMMEPLIDLATFCTEELEFTYHKIFPKVKTAIVKDRLDLSLYTIIKHHKQPENNEKEEFKILWHGSYGNIVSIDLARIDLEKLAKEFNLRLICVYDKSKQYHIKPINGVKIEEREWSNSAVISALLESDVSINPRYLPPHWKSYKSDNKTILAWSCGVPCVEKDFYKEIISLFGSAEKRNKISKEHRKYVEKNYDIKLTADEWHKIAKSLIKETPKTERKNERNTTNIVVYTAISGEKYHDTLRENQFNDRTARFEAFLDKPQESNIWHVNKIFKQFIDPSRQAKIYKILPWQYLPDYQYSIWIDGCISILVSPKMLIDTYLKNADIAMFKHHDRDDIYEEYKADLHFLHRKLEPEYLFRMQIDKYKKEGFPEHSGLNECTVILRRHTEEVKRMCEEWWSEITTYTVSDQCSFAYVLRKHNLKVNNIPGTILNNKFFERGKREYTK